MLYIFAMKTRLSLSGLALVVTYFAALTATGSGGSPGAGAALSVVTVVCFGWFIFEEIRCLRILDELQRRIQLEALAVAFPLSILLVVALGLAERQVTLSQGDLSYRHLWPFFVMFYFLGLAISRRRYR